LLKHFIVGGLLTLFACAPMAAQEAEPTPHPDSQALDGWLYAEQLNLRCHLLHYFEVRLVEDSVFTAQNNAPEFKQVKFDRSMEVEESVARLVQMLADRRAQAAAAMQEVPCDPRHPAIQAVRTAYAPHFMQMLAGSGNAPERASAPAGQNQAYDNLIAFMQSLYGAAMEEQSARAVAVLGEQMGNWTPSGMWSALAPHLMDVNWQNRLTDHGYTYRPERVIPPAFRPHSRDGDSSLPMLLKHRQDQPVWLAEGSTTLYRASGRLDDGRLLIALASHSKDNPAGDLRATLFMQDGQDLTAWGRDDWRTGATAFEAEQLPTSACPLDYCFAFPASAAERMATDLATGGLVSYELYIGAPETYPLSLDRPSYNRKKAYFTDFSVD
jgi:hypothetical protein